MGSRSSKQSWIISPLKIYNSICYDKSLLLYKQDHSLWIKINRFKSCYRELLLDSKPLQHKAPGPLAVLAASSPTHTFSHPDGVNSFLQQ